MHKTTLSNLLLLISSKVKFLTTKHFYHQCITLSASSLGTSKCFSFSLFFKI